MNHNLACTVHRHSLATPDALAIAHEGHSLSYAELAKRAAQLAQCLQQSPGWGRRGKDLPRIGIFASRSIEACVAMIGTCWAGATYVPISLKLPEERILALLSACDFLAIVTDESGAKRLGKALPDAAPPLLIVSPAQAPYYPQGGRMRFPARNPQAMACLSEPARIEASDTAYIIFTSGTTGVPKGVMISAGSIRKFIAMISERLQLTRHDRALETCELSFDVSMHNMFSTWEAGASLHILPAAQVMDAVNFAREHQLSVWNSVPSLAGMLRQIKALRAGVLPQLRLTVFGGEALPEAVVAAWRIAAPNSRVHNLYGPTEVTVYCFGQLVGNPTPLTPGRDVVQIGTPLPGNDAVIFDEYCQVVADGTPGQLAITGVQLADGYLDAPDLTAQRFVTRLGKRWYLTGDLAIRDQTGAFHYLGRMDNQVKVLGHRIELEEIDAHLRVVANADLVGSLAWPLVGGSALGIVAFVGAKNIDADQIVKDLRQRLPSYMVPNAVLALENMPLNQSGKVDRRALQHYLVKKPT